MEKNERFRTLLEQLRLADDEDFPHLQNGEIERLIVEKKRGNGNSFSPLIIYCPSPPMKNCFSD
ncbi:hypothetical protein Cdeb_02080 [Caldibacillus debilis GB1]|uniref:DNA polymerase III PolC-type N-terminal domain-containing protein n=1 Tax=Caldibacillus debilis GB1 TaxID=1339248 RepID=A0A420VBE5_9BACI|nr:hypothetical protein Cdeb_02080 [Caldibacillus debilis GB1]